MCTHMYVCTVYACVSVGVVCLSVSVCLCVSVCVRAQIVSVGECVYCMCMSVYLSVCG
jgi:hypothetical protein